MEPVRWRVNSIDIEENKAAFSIFFLGGGGGGLKSQTHPEGDSLHDNTTYTAISHKAYRGVPFQSFGMKEEVVGDDSRSERGFAN